MSSPPACTISDACRDEVPLILEMVRELAEFEHLLHEVVATEAGLADHLFGARPFAEIVIARVGADVAGFALYFHNYSTFMGRPGLYLEDLYIRPAFRGQGCGKALLTHVARLAAERGCGRFEWSVLDWNQRAIDFYVKLGARPMSDWTIMRVTGDALQKMGAAP